MVVKVHLTAYTWGTWGGGAWSLSRLAVKIFTWLSRKLGFRGCQANYLTAFLARLAVNTWTWQF